MSHRHWTASVLVSCLLGWVAAVAFAEAEGSPIDIADRRELFVDRYLVASLRGAEMMLHEPVDRGEVLRFDKPWEGRFAGYVTILHDEEAGLYRMYYRGHNGATKAKNQVTCYAESRDGIHWDKPALGLYTAEGSKENNVTVAGVGHNIVHNFSPMIDANPSRNDAYPYKAVGGTGALYALGSRDGKHWEMLRSEPILTVDRFAFDSQNVVFWSSSERKYLAYIRLWVDDEDPDQPPHADVSHGIRTIARAESDDFIHWSEPELMRYSDTDSVTPSNHFYTNQTHPYFRAPHLYLAVAARFMPGRQVLSAEQARAIHAHPDYFKDASDTVLMTSRGGTTYDRTFLDALIRPGIGARNWVSRSNYPVLNIVPTGETEMSLYLNEDYGQPTAHVRRYSLRLDGLASVHASHAGGEMVTHPLLFQGSELKLNFSTSAAGGVRVEVQNAQGHPIPGYTLDESVEMIGDEMDRTVRWQHGTDMADLASEPIRLRFVMNEADLYAMWFE